MFKILYCSVIGITLASAAGGLSASQYASQKNIFEKTKSNTAKNLEAEIQTLENQKTKKSQNLGSYEQKLNELTIEKNKYSERDIKESIKELRTKIAGLKTQISDDSSVDLLRKIDEIKDFITSIEKEISTKENQLNEINKNISNIDSIIQNSKSQFNTAAENKNNMTKLSSEADAAYTEANQNNEKRKQAQSSYDKCQSSNISNTSTGKKQAQKNPSKNNICKSQQAELSKYSSINDEKVNQLKAAKDLANKNKSDAEKKFNTTQQEHEKQKSATQTLNQSLSQFKSQISNLTSLKDEAIKLHADAIKEKQNLDNSLTQKTQESLNLNQQKNTLGEEIHNKKVEKNLQEEEIVKLNTKNKNISDFQIFNKEYDKQNNELKKYQKILSDIETTNTQISREKEKIQKLIARIRNQKSELEKIQEQKFKFSISKAPYYKKLKT